MTLFRACFGGVVGTGPGLCSVRVALLRRTFLSFRSPAPWQPLVTKSSLPPQLCRWLNEITRALRRECLRFKPKDHLGRRGAVFSFGLVGVRLTVEAQQLHAAAATGKNRLVGLDQSTTAEDGQEKEKERFAWRQFLSYLLPHFWYLVAAVICAMAVAALNIRIPQMLGSLVNVVAHYATGQQQGEDLNASFMQEMKAPAVNMIKLYIAQSVMTFGYIYSLSCVGERVATQMRHDLFASVVRQDIAFFDNHKCGEIVSRLTADVQDFKSAFKLCISQGLRSFAQTIGCGFALYSISPQLTGIMMIVVPIVIVTGTGIGSLLRSLSRRAQSQVAKATAVGEECISNIRTVRAFAMEETEEGLYIREVKESQRLNELLGLGIGVFQAGSNLFLNGIVLATLYYGGSLLSSNRLLPGDLMSFLVATQTIQRSLAQLSMLFGQFIKGLTAGTRVFEYINMTPTIPVSGGKIIPYHSLVGDIVFNHVTFRYPTRPEQVVLKDFSLRIPAGQMVALVGTSGGGKSTVAALLERFYEVGEGSITVDGVDIRELDPKWLRGKAIGYINQEIALFACSIMENIRYGRPSATDQEVLEAAKSSHCDDFVKGFPEGYATVLGERGVTVSGGQKQRIAIARALLKNPSILILDEATSALDSESENIVQEALEGMSKGRTVLVIAHRLSTIQNADLIAVVSNGAIAEMGTHDELTRKRGLYFKLTRQLEDEEELERSQSK